MSHGELLSEDNWLGSKSDKTVKSILRRKQW